MGFELWINSWPNDGFFFYFIWKTWIAQGEPWSFVQQVYLALIQSVACCDDTIIKICLMDVNKPQASAERPAIFTPNECSCLVTANKQPGQAVQNILISIFQTSSSESSTLGYIVGLFLSIPGLQTLTKKLTQLSGDWWHSSVLSNLRDGIKIRLSSQRHRCKCEQCVFTDAQVYMR